MGTYFVATVTVPGYLPMDDEPPTFDSAQEAWSYLADERTRAEDDAPEWVDHECPRPADCEYSETRETLCVLATEAHWSNIGGESVVHEWLTGHGLATDGTGAIYGRTPGYDGDHDLGLAYSVFTVVCEYSNARFTGTLNCSIHGAYPECLEETEQ